MHELLIIFLDLLVIIITTLIVRFEVDLQPEKYQHTRGTTYLNVQYTYYSCYTVCIIVLIILIIAPLLLTELVLRKIENNRNFIFCKIDLIFSTR